MVYYRWRPGEGVTPCELADWSNGSRRVAWVKVGDVAVSTAFLPIDHRYDMSQGLPIVFETMIFEGTLDGECWRYSTEEEARAGHAHAVALVELIATEVGMAAFKIGGLHALEILCER